VSEIEKVLEEARRVYAYRDKELGANAPKFLCIGLSSRRNLCIHPRVSEEKDALSTDSQCRNLTASWVRERSKTAPNVELCDFYEQFQTAGKDSLLYGVYSLEDLKQFGREHNWCPYFLARRLVAFADVIVFSYQYIIDPKVSELISKEFKANSIVVFDEAHNIGTYLDVYSYIYIYIYVLLTQYYYSRQCVHRCPECESE
jgi:DNA excision repair protein ERCC-2